MSDDLISRKAVIALIDALGYINVGNQQDFKANCRIDKIRQRVVELQTAFDKEKVIQSIESEYLKTRCKNSEVCKYPESIGCCYDRAIGKVLDIIRKHMNDG